MMQRVLGCSYRSILVKGVAALFLALVLAMAPVASASAAVVIPPPPAIPQTFFGTITVNGYDVPAGKVIVAKVNGLEYYEITTMCVGKYGSDAEGHFGPGSQMLAVKKSGTTSFYLGTMPAEQVVVSVLGETNRLDLTLLALSLPVAKAGSDQTAQDTDDNGMETILLDGAASYDPDLNVTAWEWAEGSTVLATEAAFSGAFAVGNHTVTLKVTDTSGLTASDDVVVTVNAVEQPPVEPPVTPPVEPPVTPPVEPPVTPPVEPPVTPPSGTSVTAPSGTSVTPPSGSQPSTPTSPSEPTTPSGKTPASTESGQGSGMNWLLWAVSMIGAVIVAVLATFLIIGRRTSRV